MKETGWPGRQNVQLYQIFFTKYCSADLTHAKEFLVSDGEASGHFLFGGEGFEGQGVLIG
jgi:hypothetical protein